MSVESLVSGEPSAEAANNVINESLVGASYKDEVEEKTSEVETNPEEKAGDEESKVETEIKFDDFKVPEGITLDETFASEFKGIAKDLKLNQEQAQKLVDLQTKYTQDYSSKIETQFKTQVDAWKEESITELGANYKTELSKVAKAMDTFGSPELRTLLNDTGLGNHKEVVKLFLNVANKISEDSIRDSNSNKSRVEKSLAEKHYPNSKNIN